MENIRGKMAAGATWMVAMRFADRGIGLLSMLVLARLLMPHDFGIVAMAMSFVAVLELMTAFGFDVALIQKKAPDRDHWDTAWTISVIFGVLIAAVLVTLAGPVARFYRSIELEHVIRALALCSIIQGFENIGVVAFRRELQFDREFRFLVSKKIASFAVTIPAALLLGNYWALVIGQTAGKLAGTIMSYAIHSYRPRMTLTAVAGLMNFSKWILATNLTTYLQSRAQDWILGRTAGPQGLGTYNLGAEIAALPSTELIAPVNRALLPAYSRIAGSLDSLRQEFLMVLSLVALVGTPAVVGLAASAPLMVPVVLGSNWLGVEPVIMILSLGGVVQVLMGNIYPVYIAIGRPDLIVKLNLLPATSIVILMLVLAPRFGTVGAAAASVVSSLLVAPVSLYLAMRIMSVRFAELVRAVWRPLVSASAMFVTVFLYSSQAEDRLTALLAAVAMGVAIYPTGVLLLWLLAGRPEGGERMLWRRAVAAWNNVRGAAGGAGRT